MANIKIKINPKMLKTNANINVQFIFILVDFFKFALTCLCMISLRVSATKLVNKNEPEEIPKEFPSRLELAMNYTGCYKQVFNSVIFAFPNSASCKCKSSILHSLSDNI